MSLNFYKRASEIIEKETSAVCCTDIILNKTDNVQGPPSNYSKNNFYSV